MDAVAREARVSKALVHYYFATRDELIRAAFLYSDHRATTRIEAELVLEESGAERLARFLVLDLDDEPVFAESRALWSEAWSLMRRDELLRPDVERLYRAWNDRLLGLLEEGQTDGSIPSHIDARGSAERLSALVDGLESQLLLGLVTSEEATEIVRSSIDREFGQERAPANRSDLGNVT
jgi:AcrR family transcriptional regulator